MSVLEITIKDYLMGRDERNFLHPEVKKSAENTVLVVNRLLSYFPGYGVVLEAHPSTKTVISSGWRPAELNAWTPGAAPKSKHITGCACDIYDPDGAIDDFLMDNNWLLKELGLFMEHPSATKGWCHVQTVPPKSGKLIFYP